MGKVPQVNTERVNLARTVTSLFVKEAEIADLWRLDVLGIKDSMEKKSKQEIDLKTKERFKETVIFNQDNKYHIEGGKGFDCEFKKILKQIFDVDNVVASLNSHEDLNDFIFKSSHLMLQDEFELRDWESTGCKTEHDRETPVLGMKWNRQLDSLYGLPKVNVARGMENVHRMGYRSYINLRKEFLQCFQDLKILEEIHVSRWINVTAENLKHCTIHTFCDASKDAYAAVVFLRLEEEGSVKLSLLAA
ncbi:hypothetical protein AVEN_43264-1 [Araneus ventricosus]|uniref:Uncharacterized protein n=1 Tax=Araneus ventricosus TaxID=182803 RepID=A0A4Y2GCT7_ARAVE|nr:hypothetical protein AVEN_43264-1 [Araneus ventricosus]